MRTSHFTSLLVIAWVLSACSQTESESLNATATRPATPAEAAMPVGGREVILFLGDSLSAGFGVDPDQAFPALIQHKIDRLGWEFKVVNAGVSGDTSADGLSRVDWLLRRPLEVLFLELGGNDALRGIPLEVTRQNLQRIVDKTRSKYPGVKIIVAGMRVPPNLGPEYTREFRAIFPVLAQAKDATLIPFLLEGVGGRPQLNLPDGIHPTPEGHQIVAEHVWGFLRPVLESLTQVRASERRSPR